MLSEHAQHAAQHAVWPATAARQTLIALAENTVLYPLPNTANAKAHSEYLRLLGILERYKDLGP